MEGGAYLRWEEWKLWSGGAAAVDLLMALMALHHFKINLDLETTVSNSSVGDQDPLLDDDERLSLHHTARARVVIEERHRGGTGRDRTSFATGERKGKGTEERHIGSGETEGSCAVRREQDRTSGCLRCGVERRA
jgi:hypothetical protein